MHVQATECLHENHGNITAHVTARLRPMRKVDSDVIHRGDLNVRWCMMKD